MLYVLYDKEAKGENNMYDVIVCGGGSAGFAAALAAARTGAKTLLIESGGCLGGIWTQGCLGYVMDRRDKTGIIGEVAALMGQLPDGADNFMFDIETMKYRLEELCVEAGVEITYHTKVVGVQKEGDRIQGIHTQSKSGEEYWESKTFIDCTGDGDVGYFAECAYELGKDGFCQPMSFNCVVGGIRFEEVKECVFNNQELYCEDAKENFRQELLKAGITPSYTKPTLGHIREDIFVLAINHQYDGKGLSREDVTKATLEGRKEVFEAVEALKKVGPRWSRLQVLQSPAYIGVREGRRIQGLYTVTKEDLIEGRRQEDGICTVYFCVDIHNQDGYTEGGVKTKPYEIPVRALISKEVENLMMAGRCISGDFYAHASYRVSGNTVRMGEVAGIVCAMAAKENKLPKEIGIDQIKAGSTPHTEN